MFNVKFTPNCHVSLLGIGFEKEIKKINIKQKINIKCKKET